jgi:hypothetical protein
VLTAVLAAAVVVVITAELAALVVLAHKVLQVELVHLALADNCLLAQAAVVLAVLVATVQALVVQAQAVMAALQYQLLLTGAH